jgi:hypothetical protein
MVDGVLNCLHGHPMTDENIYYLKATGRPACRECLRISQKKAYDKRKLLYGKGE